MVEHYMFPLSIVRNTRYGRREMRLSDFQLGTPCKKFVLFVLCSSHRDKADNCCIWYHLQPYTFPHRSHHNLLGVSSTARDSGMFQGHRDIGRCQATKFRLPRTPHTPSSQNMVRLLSNNDCVHK